MSDARITPNRCPCSGCKLDALNAKLADREGLAKLLQSLNSDARRGGQLKHVSGEDLDLYRTDAKEVIAWLMDARDENE